jgi:hypothetical protein
MIAMAPELQPRTEHALPLVQLLRSRPRCLLDA